MHHANFEKRACDYWATCLRTRLVSTDGVSAFSSMETVNRTRDMLLTELKAIQHLVTLTVARVNDLSITARLPAEVLTHVFSVLTECDPPSSEPLKGDRFGDKASLGWITATHVCRRWRHMALSAPALWTNIGAPPTGPWMNEMLARSKQVPFAFSACITRDHKICDAVLKAVSADYMSRLKDLRLSGEEREWSEDIEELDPGSLGERRLGVLANLNHPAPMLESLTLDAIIKILPLHIFARTAPRLRRFTIRECKGVHWDAPYLRNLTDLQLDIAGDLSLAKLLAVLKESPLLENLRAVGRNTVSGERLPCGNVPLLSLKTLVLHSWADTSCMEFLSSLTIPSAARKDFEFKACNAEVAPRIISLATGVVETTDTISRPTPSKMQLHHDHCLSGRSDITMRVWFEADFEVVQPRLSLRWTSSGTYPAAGHTTAEEQLLGSFDVHKLTDLSMSSEEFGYTLYDTFKNAISKMSAVRDLTLKGRGIDNFLQLLRTTPHGQIPDLDYPELYKAEAFLLPNLDKLQITGVPLSKTTPGFRYAWTPNLGESLLTMLKTRKALGNSVPILVITECDDSEGLSPELAEHVENLRCDSCSNA
ncbi:hypothetical protein EWM64_g8374 [Hericium alpestre]|uniref:F-box domain-containing protein n=1 Tax=Hericium alpestre TaxID=135208 RepID=A0A4Y9ZLA8_9AGAM|nr:hypothetical protein EWM64_g8374 [Hericium alpestre]